MDSEMDLGLAVDPTRAGVYQEVNLIIEKPSQMIRGGDLIVMIEEMQEFGGPIAVDRCREMGRNWNRKNNLD